MGFHNAIISYMHYYFHNERVLLTQAFASSTTATTVGDGGQPRGSTELDDETGHNCRMSNKEFQMFAHLVLGLNSGDYDEGFAQTDHSFLNMLLNDYNNITNLNPTIHNEIEGDRRALA